VEATCAGTHVTVVLNGERVIDADLSQIEATRDPEREGYNCVQKPPAPAKFRNISVKEL
jgi:hypothetical protein